MKVFQSSVFRSLCAIIVGALLVKYREQTVTWLTVFIGGFFFVTGLVSVIAYFSAKRKSTGGDLDIYDANGNLIVQSKPTFPIVGLGSLILGALLGLFPNSFVNGLMYVMAAILILGAINQFYNLTVARRFAHIGIVWWIVPSLILLVGIVAIIKPSVIATAPLLVIGWCMMVYGVVEIINSIKIQQCRRRFRKAMAASEAQSTETTADEQPAESPADAQPADTPQR